MFFKKIQKIYGRTCARIFDYIFKRFVYKIIYSRSKLSRIRFIKWAAFKFLSIQYRRSVKLHINSECNLRCKHCYSKKKNTALSKSELFHFFDQLKNSMDGKIIRLDILGGEPLLRDDFIEIIRYAKTKLNPPEIQVYTNGTLINFDKALEMKNAGVNSAIISLHSHINHKHDLITGVEGSWEKTVSAIKACLKAGLETYAFIILFPDTVDFLPEIEAFVNGLGAKTTYLSYIMLNGENQSCFGNLQRARDWVINKSEKHKTKTLLDLKLKKRICTAFINTISIDCDGIVKPCPFVDLNLGNIKENRLKDILNKSFYNEKLVKLLETPEECKKCSIVDICGGGCKASRYSACDDLSSKDGNCAGPFDFPIDPKDIGKYLPYVY